jgi:hypothetical protein
MKLVYPMLRYKSFKLKLVTHIIYMPLYAKILAMPLSTAAT